MTAATWFIIAWNYSSWFDTMHDIPWSHRKVIAWGFFALGCIVDRVRDSAKKRA